MKKALTTSSYIFALVAIVHAYRYFAQTPIVIGGTSIPDWASVLAVVVAGFMAIWTFYYSRMA